MRRPSLLKWERCKRPLLRFFYFFLVTGIVCSALFVASAWNAQSDFKPVEEKLPEELQAFIDKTPAYQREEVASYLTFPEWYLVFAPQEYGDYISRHSPSGFPYFTLIGQFWSSYAEVAGIAGKNYPFNPGNHLMVVVIGTSSTVEFGIKGIYENTVGRLFEWFSSGESTDEDLFAAKVARDYGNFIPTQPWFEFPYGQKFKGLWTECPLFGPHFPRKCERKLFLSVEYGIKWLYAGVIRMASHSVYGVADTQVYASVTTIAGKSFDRPGVEKVLQLENGNWIIKVPHYQGFTDTVPLLAEDGVEFQEIGGSNEILLTLIAPVSPFQPMEEGRQLFSMQLISNDGLQRVALQVPVKSLAKTLREAKSKQYVIEHLFDY